MKCQFHDVDCHKHHSGIPDAYEWIDKVCKKCPKHPDNLKEE